MPERLFGRPQRFCPPRRTLEAFQRGGDQGRSIVIIRPVVERVEVVLGDDRGDLIAFARLLEVPRHRQVPRLAIAARQCLVGDRAHERLHESVLASLRREPVRVDLEDLFADQLLENVLQVRDRAHGLERVAGERHPVRGGVLHHLTFGRCQRVEPRRDQGLKAWGGVERAEIDPLARIRREHVAAFTGNHHVAVDQPAHHLEGVERNPFRAFDERAAGLFRQPLHEPVHDLHHHRFAERLEIHGGGPAPRAPAWTSVNELRTSEGHHEQREASVLQ